MISNSPDPTNEEVLADLRQRLRSTRRVSLPRSAGWDRGSDPDYLAVLVQYWSDEYDWRAHERRILSLPWVCTGTGTSTLRSVHQPARSAGSPTVVLLHGWPDSVLRFERVLPLLGDVNVIVPALPGFPFSARLDTLGMSVTTMATIVADSLHELGYDRYVLSAGDVGGDVAEQLAVAYPERVAALHLTNLSPRHLRGVDTSQLSAQELAFLSNAQQWLMSEGGYIAEQSTKPHTLAVGLGDSPAGLAAWIVEKLRSWSDCGGDVESIFAREDLLTWITVYWVSGCIGTSFGSYVERPAPVERVRTPTAMSVFPHDINIAPRALAARFLNIESWVEHDTGGHFAAWEQPCAYTEGIRAAIALGKIS